MGSFSLCLSNMKRNGRIYVFLTIQLFAGFSKSCDCNADNLLLNKMDKLNEDIAKLVRDDMHFDASHVARGPSDFMSNGFVFKRSEGDGEHEGEKRGFGGYLN